MKIHVKLLLAILTCLTLVYAGVFVFREIRMARRVQSLAEANLNHEEEVQWQSIENLQRACNTALNDAMTQGEMDQFRKLLEAQKEIVGLMELTVFDHKGRAADSTVANVKKTQLPAALVERMQKEKTPWREKTDDAFILYQPMPVTPECYECHPGFKKIAVGGLFRYKFNTVGLQQAQDQWRSFSEELQHENRQMGLWMAILLLSLSGGAIIWIVRVMIAKPLTSISEELNRAADEVERTAGTITSASQSLAEGSQAQAASLEETSAAVEETTSMARRTAEDAERTRAAASETRAAVAKASEAMGQMSERMAGIQSATHDVGRILKTIDEIAFQTNLLALNAAVEAARAGDAGAGFAVVADEVRSLAQRSAEAARSTAHLTEQVTRQVNEGADISRTVGEHLAEITQKIETEDGLIQQITRASIEQDKGLEQINRSVASIDEVTQKAAAVSEETAAAARELFHQSERLAGDVDALFLLLNGKPKDSAASGEGSKQDPATKTD